ncbi:MAG: tripartite tricarboxylate transporter substrate binding protein [Burkholderiales bacterium]|nr:tripartite tricarboxylate transporter substrate binding protein [Burkholderiales bacterium]
MMSGGTLVPTWCRRAGMLAWALAPALAPAQSYPEKPIRMIVAVPAGGSPDRGARMVQPGLSSVLGQQIIVDNRGGAGGLIGADLAAKAPADGYTLFFSAPGPLTVIPHVQKQVPYDTLKDFDPISLVAVGPFLVLVHPSVPARNVKELITLAKSQPGKLNYASAGVGSSNHLATELLKSMVGMDITHVLYKGAPQATLDVLAGSVDLTLISIPSALPHMKSGRLRALAITSLKRSPMLPDIPTVSEAGIAGYEWGTWFGLLAPAKTPAPIIARLHAALVKVVRGPELKTQLESLGYDAVGNTPQEFAAAIRSEWHKNAKVAKIAGAKVD